MIVMESKRYKPYIKSIQPYKPGKPIKEVERELGLRGVVKLAWSDGTRGAYRVYKSTDPRDLDRAEVHVVKGNVWTDSEAGTGPIVFYRIE